MNFSLVRRNDLDICDDMSSFDMLLCVWTQSLDYQTFCWFFVDSTELKMFVGDSPVRNPTTGTRQTCGFGRTPHFRHVVDTTTKGCSVGILIWSKTATIHARQNSQQSSPTGVRRLLGVQSYCTRKYWHPKIRMVGCCIWKGIWHQENPSLLL